MSLLKKQLFIVFLFLITITFSQQNKKVLLIGIDGLQFEKISEVKTPNFDKFTIKKGFTGGLIGTNKEQVTYSGPGWMTLLTGVWADKHQVMSNSSEQFCKAKSIFYYIEKSDSKKYTSSISTWKNINLLLLKDLYYVDFFTGGGNDELSVQIARNQIEKYTPDFIFIHLDDVDHAGHSKGFGIFYHEAIEKIDKQIGILVKSVKKRERKYNEDWLIILVTDHGRDKKGFGHGKQTLSEKTIFIGLNKKGNKFFNNIDNTKISKTLKELENNTIPQTAIVPTILKHLNIPVNKEWNLEAKALID